MNKSSPAELTAEIMEKPDTVYMICRSDETGKLVGDCLKRVAATMSAFNSYIDAAVEIDEDAPDFFDKIGPPLERLTMTVVNLYPDPRQFEADIKSIGDFTIRKI